MARFRSKKLPDPRVELSKVQSGLESVGGQAKRSLEGFREGLNLPKKPAPVSSDLDVEQLILLEN